MSILNPVRPKAWRAPDTSGTPLVLNPDEMTELGTIGGIRWFQHAVGELEQRPQEYTDQDALPSILTIGWRADERVYAGFNCHSPGTFAALRDAKPKPRKVPTLRPGDLLDLATLVGPTQPFIHSPGQPKARGPVAILARLEARGRRVALAADGEHLIVSAPDGRIFRDVLDLLELAGPLLVAYLKGTPLRCGVSAHPTPTPATTIAVGGAAWCGECSA